ncbi:hypothetical protein FRC07_002373 [Ceratobasidium sp. 392]|nr:hypothetical protein FRC07_002373 [Ceratobasidium sp. 392]
MSKHTAVGAYALISDDENPLHAAPPPKEPYTPVRLSAPTFRMPQTASSQVGTGMLRRVCKQPSTPPNTPAVPARTLGPSLSEAGPSTPPSQPSREAFERELHEINYTVANCLTKIVEQEKEIRFLWCVADETRGASVPALTAPVAPITAASTTSNPATRQSNRSQNHVLCLSHLSTSSIHIELPGMQPDIAPLLLSHLNHVAPPRAFTNSLRTTPAPTLV